MKSIQWALIASLIIPFSASAQQAQVLPEFLERELDTVSAGTAFQLEANKTVDAVSAESNYKDRVEYAVERDLKGFNGSAKNAFGISVATTVFGAGGTFAGLMTGGFALESSANTKSATKLGMGVEEIMSSSLGTFVGAGISAWGLDNLIHEAKVKSVLNETKADQYSAAVAKMFAKILGLDTAKESALKFAVREEIYQKVKTGDDKPLDIYKILGSVKYAGKNIVSASDLATLAALKKKDDADHGFVPQEKNKVFFLIAGNAFLKEQLKLGKLKESEEKKVRSQISGNDAVIAKLQEFHISTGEAKSAPADETKESDAQ